VTKKIPSGNREITEKVRETPEPIRTTGVGKGWEKPPNIFKMNTEERKEIHGQFQQIYEFSDGNKNSKSEKC